MVLIYTLLAVLLVTAALYIVTLIFGYQKNKFVRQLRHSGVIAVCALAVCALAVMCLVCGLAVRSEIDKVQTRYDELMLYYNTVNDSTNEYVRYDYFDKVEAYNALYERNALDADGWFLAAFYPSDWNADCGPINFELHGDYYGLE